VRRRIAGDLVECGAARGGSALLLTLAAARLGDARRTWVFDTFEGLPEPSAADPDFAEAKQYVGTCRGELHEVEALFASAGVRDRVTFVKGLFQDTLAERPVPRIAVLHLDGDWYDSVRVCLERLYDGVAPGGIIQIDDYGHWAGARKAVDEFFRRRGMPARLRYVDYTGRTFTKPSP
jgi:O-methyltransferase